MFRDRQVVGAIAMYRSKPGRFADNEVELLRAFAGQAVIAIENVRLFNETKEALERQTATSDVLQVISESPTDVQPVFDIIAERAAALTAGRIAPSRASTAKCPLVALHGVNEAGTTRSRRMAAGSWRDGASMPPARSARRRSQRPRPAGADRRRIRAEHEARRELAGFRSGSPCRCCATSRSSARSPSTAPRRAVTPTRKSTLLQTFARQAVIAIENVRLFNETKEALEQQTATPRSCG